MTPKARKDTEVFRSCLAATWFTMVGFSHRVIRTLINYEKRSLEELWLLANSQPQPATHVSQHPLSEGPETSGKL